MEKLWEQRFLQKYYLDKLIKKDKYENRCYGNIYPG